MTQKMKTRFVRDGAGSQIFLPSQQHVNWEFQPLSQSNLEVTLTGDLAFPLLPSDSECLLAVKSINNFPRLSRDARRVGITLACLASEGRLAVGVEELGSKSGQHPARVIAGLIDLNRVGLAQRVSGRGFGLVWRALT